jgi:hypothetical protein
MHIGPVGHRHINFRGTYRFPIDRYAARLIAISRLDQPIVRRSAQDASFDMKSTRPSILVAAMGLDRLSAGAQNFSS